MATTSQKINWRIWWSRVLFIVVVFFTSNCFVDNWRMPFFLNDQYRNLKLFLSFALPLIVTIIEYFNNHSFKFIGRATSIISASFVVMYFIDSVTLKWINDFGKWIGTFHLIYGLVTVWTVMLSVSVIKLFKRQEDNHYISFYNDFFIGEAVMLVFVFIMLYFVIRNYDKNPSINFALFHGELKTTLEVMGRDTIMRTVGNVFVYTAISLTVIRFAKAHKMLFGAVIPIAISLACEAFQYITACGDADIDDVFTNTLGVLIGLLVYKLFFSKLLRRKV